MKKYPSIYAVRCIKSCKKAGDDNDMYLFSVDPSSEIERRAYRRWDFDSSVRCQVKHRETK